MRYMKFLNIAVLSLLFSLSHAASFSQGETQESCGFKYTKDQFGNTHIVVNKVDLATKDFGKNLREFVRKHKPEQEGVAFFVNVTHKQYKALSKAGFQNNFSDNSSVQWMIRNGSPMPLPYSATQGARVILMKLIEKSWYIGGVKDKDRSALMFPGGSVNLGEAPHDAGVRELKEEVDVSIVSEKLKRIATVYRKKGNRYGMNDVCEYYVARVSAAQKMVPDNKEIEYAFWVPLKQVIETGAYETLKASHVTMEILRHINTRGKSRRVSLLDYRQLRKADPDKSDTLTLELIATL